MDDPNVVYKRAFAELREELGRIPTANELLGLHDQYKKAFLSLPSEVEKADKEFAMRQRHNMAEMAAAGRPVSNAREGRDQPLSGPGIIPTGVGGLDSLSPSNPPSRIDDGAMVGARGPGGGIYAKCGSCGRVWEREKKRGRPARMCGGCK